jgi:hypothetical protein
MIQDDVCPLEQSPGDGIRENAHNFLIETSLTLEHGCVCALFTVAE